MESDLLTLSEIAVALGGFASIVVLFRRSPDGRWDRSTAYGFRDMITVALGAGAWSALPFLAAQFNDGTANWRFLCGLFGCTQFMATSFLAISRWGKLGPRPMAYFAAGSLLGHLAISLLLLVAALGVLPVSPSATYVTGIAWLLVSVGGWFLYLVAIPESNIE